MAQEMGIPFLGGIPIITALRVNCDTGNPSANFEPEDSPLKKSLETMAQNLAGQVSMASMRHVVAEPTISIS